MKYDSREDTLKHIQAVRGRIFEVVLELAVRAKDHDASKLEEPEKSMYDTFRPLLSSLDVASQEYKDALASMGEGLKHHYLVNRHHPEHFNGRVADMNLVDVIEMVCDWYEAAKANGKTVNIEYLKERFRLDDQLAEIISNQLKEFDK